MPPALVELRVLDGANLYFPRPAVKLTLDLTTVLDASDAVIDALAVELGLGSSHVGGRGTAQRQRFAARAVARLVRQVATEAGTARLAVRARPAADLRRLVVAYPWRRLGRATALGEAVAAVLDDLAAPGARVDESVFAAAARVRAAPAGRTPALARPRVPVVAVTGTNGKTTTTRLIAHIGRAAGHVVGWSNTDGVYVDGEVVETGDYSGPSGAGMVLADPRVQLAVTETARGGILLRGVGVTHNDVAVVTNVSADHLGLHGVDTLDQLAEVKAVITRITRPEGWVVLNADDPRTFAMRLGARARCVAFSRDPDSPNLRHVLDEGGRAVTLLDGHVTVIDRNGDTDELVPVVDVPVTLAGLSRHNVENVLAAAGAAIAVRLPRAAVVEGLRTFAADADANPGRMNVYDLAGVTVVVDLAHNEAGLQALVEVAAGLRAPGGVVRLVLGGVGDRTDDVLRGMGELAALRADDVVVGHKRKYLRDRTVDQMHALFGAGAAAAGLAALTACDDELAATQLLLGRSAAGDVVAVMCHEQRAEIHAALLAAGGTVAGPEMIRAKVRHCR